MDDLLHYSDVIMDAIASQITSLTVVYSNVYSGAGGEPTKFKCNYIRANVITFAQM